MEKLGSIFTCAQHDLLATGMNGNVVRHIVDKSIDDRPTIFIALMIWELVHGYRGKVCNINRKLFLLMVLGSHLLLSLFLRVFGILH